MNKTTKKEDARGQFKNLLGKDVTPTIQKVHPQKQTPSKENHEDLVQLMVWIPASLMVKIKTKTVLDKKSMKEIVTEIMSKNI